MSNFTLSFAMLRTPIPPSKIKHCPPVDIVAELRAIEQEIMQGTEELEGMLR